MPILYLKRNIQAYFEYMDLGVRLLSIAVSNRVRAQGDISVTYSGGYFIVINFSVRSLILKIVLVDNYNILQITDYN